jgi:hypothetical protein
MVQLSLTAITALVGILTHTALAAPRPTQVKRAASCSFPNPSPSTDQVLPAATTILAGKSFDGKYRLYFPL